MARNILNQYGQPIPRTVTPTKERGVGGTAVYGGYIMNRERSAKLFGAQRYITASEMVGNISIIAAGLRYFLNLVAKPKWKVEVEGKEENKYTEFVEECMEDMVTPWPRIVRRAGFYRFHGFGIHEWTAKKRDDGQTGMSDIEVRPCHTIERWETDDRGTVTGVWQRSPQTQEEIGLPRSKIIYLIDDTLTDSPEGMGWFRHLVEPADRLKKYLQLEGMGFQRDLNGIPLGRAPLKKLQQMVADSTISQAEMDQAIAGIEDFVKLQARNPDTGLLLDSQPHEFLTADGNSLSGVPEWDLTLLQATVGSIPNVNTAILRLIEEMARIMGVENLLTGSNGAGSLALSKDKSQNLYLLVDSTLQDMAATFTTDWVEPLKLLNGWPEDVKIRLKTEAVAFRDVEQITNALASMAQAGAPLAPNDEAINDVRDLLGVAHAEPVDPALMGMTPQIDPETGEPIPGAAPSPFGAKPNPFGAKKPPFGNDNEEEDDEEKPKGKNPFAKEAPQQLVLKHALVFEDFDVTKFDEDQARGPDGKWTSGDGGSFTPDSRKFPRGVSQILSDKDRSDLKELFARLKPKTHVNSGHSADWAQSMLDDESMSFAKNADDEILAHVEEVLKARGLPFALEKYSDDQPRDEGGQWSDGGGLDQSGNESEGGRFDKTPLKQAKGKAIRQAIADVDDDIVAAFGKEVTIDPSKLSTTQKTVNVDRVNQFISDRDTKPDVAAGRSGNKLLAVRRNGITAIVDGNHRAVSDLRAGRKTKVTVVDMDAAYSAGEKVNDGNMGRVYAIKEAIRRGIKKYDEDQPRDEGGQWTDGGGDSSSGGDEPISGGSNRSDPATWGNEKQVYDGFRQNHNLGLENDGMSKKAFLAKAVEMDRIMTDLGDRFPGMREALDKNRNALHGGIRLTKGGQVGHGPDSAAAYIPAHSRIEIAGGLKPGDGVLKFGTDTVGGNSFGSVFRHELGHALDKVFDFRGGEGYKNAKADGGKSLSVYASERQSEYIAEAFSAYTHPDYGKGSFRLDPSIEKQFDAAFKPRVKKYDENQPRGEDGKWSGGGASSALSGFKDKDGKEITKDQFLLYLTDNNALLSEKDVANASDMTSEDMMETYDLEESTADELWHDLNDLGDDFGDDEYIGEDDDGEPQYQVDLRTDKDHWTKLNSNIDTAEKEALLHYTQDGFSDINRLLSGRPLIGLKPGEQPHEFRASRLRESIKELDEAIARSEVKADIDVYRGGTGWNVHDWPNQVGKEIELKSYVSTSRDPKMLRSFGQEARTGTKYYIRVPKGARGLYVNQAMGLGDSEHPNEREMILPRSSKFRVSSVDAKSRTVYLEMRP